MRLHLLEPHKYPDLVRSLYGLLMILPQSTSFKLLKRRLNCASRIASFDFLFKETNTNLLSDKEEDDEKSVSGAVVVADPFTGNLDEYMKIFDEVQEKKEAYKREVLNKEKVSRLNSSLGFDFFWEK